jgi:hypothetical protein
MTVFSGVFCLVKLCNYGIPGNFLRLAAVYGQRIANLVRNVVKHLLWISELRQQTETGSQNMFLNIAQN